MTYFKRVRVFRPLALGLVLGTMLLAIGTPQAVRAQSTTGTITGTVVDATTGAPIAGAAVLGVSPTGRREATTDARGFYALQALSPDTYTVTIEANGYQTVQLFGIVVFQGQTARAGARLEKAMRVIARTQTRGAGNLVQPNQPADVYNVSGQQLNALEGGNDLHKTIYQYIQGVAGVTASGGFQTQPRIHGGDITDEAYEFDGIPIRERITGLFTTNLSDIGIANVEVYTGGLSAEMADSGLGAINTVVRQGTYPGFGNLTYGTGVNNRLTNWVLEYGGATPNGRFSWYGAMDKTNALNEYASGTTYPAVLIEGDNGPGVVKTSDIIGNFHYRPDNRNDIQVLFQNGVGEFVFGYLMQRAPGQPVPLTAVPCPGYHAAPLNPTPGWTYSGATGGTAPNGQTCPLGLYFGTANTQNGGGNWWHHYSGIGKIQWNHIIDDHSYFTLRLAENYNEYIFDQPIVEANLPQYENTSDFWVSSHCPLLPYQAGTPLQSDLAYIGSLHGRVCAQQVNWFNTGYWQDRRSEMWLGSLDYTNNVNDYTTIKAGVGQEYDINAYNVYYTLWFNANGTWPAANFLSDYPDHVPYAYVSADVHVGNLLLAPGIRYQRMWYDYPGGPLSVGIWNPTFAFTYRMGLNDTVRGSYTDSTTFVGTGYVYRNVPKNMLNGTTAYTAYFPTHTGFGANPTLIHSGDLQWEHQLGPTTTFRFGPWYNNESNVFYLYSPVTSAPGVVPVKYGPQVPMNGGVRKAFGFEAALNHIDTHPVGVSYWLTGTYDNFWTSILSSLTSSFGVTPLPTPEQNHLVRSVYDPLFSGTLTFDVHVNDWSLYPEIYYQSPTFYNIAVQSICTPYVTTSTYVCTHPAAGYSTGKVVAPYIAEPERMGTGYWWANSTLAVRLGPQKRLILGLQVTNLFNRVEDIAPCTATQLPSEIGKMYPGCGPFWPTSPQSGIPSVAASQRNSPLPWYNPAPGIYQNYSQTPRSVELFVTEKI